MQKGKQPLWVRLQLLARLTLNAGEDAANQPARLAHLDDGNDRAILVQRHQGPAQIVRLGHRGTPSIDVSDEIATLAARPIASLRWREMDSNFQYASIARWHQATDLPLPPFVEEERSESGRADYRAMSRCGYRSSGCDDSVPAPFATYQRSIANPPARSRYLETPVPPPGFSLGRRAYPSATARRAPTVRAAS